MPQPKSPPKPIAAALKRIDALLASDESALLDAKARIVTLIDNAQAGRREIATLLAKGN